METTHKLVFSDASSMDSIDDASVDLVVTSPPYPMIEMWDDAFSEMDARVEDALSDSDGTRAFDYMHEALAEVWHEVDRTVAPGGTICINIGDATRKVDGDFRLFPNHARIIDWFRDHGYHMLPDILWRKPSNRTTKFMGSGMLPTNAYVAYEHEYILVFRKGGGTRRFEPNLDARYESAYFWEERNEWFSDLWTDVTGETQAAATEVARDRTAAYPLEIPYRLINMYSIRGDTVLDPFLGTGTTTLAAMIAARDSIGYEYDETLADVIDDRLTSAPTRAESVIDARLRAHEQFLDKRDDLDFPYRATHYDFAVKTKQERDIRFPRLTAVDEVGSRYRAIHAFGDD